jgi:hypothetical protein
VHHDDKGRLASLRQSEISSQFLYFAHSGLKWHENKMFYCYQLESPSQLRLFGMKAHRPINNLHSSERKLMWGRNCRVMLAVLYYYDRVFSHGSQATVNWVFEVFRHGLQAAVNTW